VAKRLVDVIVAALGLVLAAPVLVLAAVGIRLSSPGPLLYRARLVGQAGRLFTMYKLRTMHMDRGPGSVITAERDPRVFAFGRLLRRLKIDELPQLVNVLRGEMSVVGPRPQHPDIVLRHYAPEHWETLGVRPGLASPGSLYDSTHGEPLVGSADPERAYVELLLPSVLALDIVYVRRATLRYDAAVVARTLLLIASSALGRRTFPDPPELREALSFLHPCLRDYGASSAAILPNHLVRS
jgi:lipopolysaccharide/colanic/teichoic acid biosynthesis glycosyltransferase